MIDSAGIFIFVRKWDLVVMSASEGSLQVKDGVVHEPRLRVIILCTLPYNMKQVIASDSTRVVWNVQRFGHFQSCVVCTWHYTLAFLSYLCLASLGSLFVNGAKTIFGHTVSLMSVTQYYYRYLFILNISTAVIICGKSLTWLCNDLVSVIQDLQHLQHCLALKVKHFQLPNLV